VLLDLFPEVRASVPEAELHIFGYDQAARNAAERVPLPPGVTIRGALGKRQLAAELQAAAVFVYPCTFAETFCTSVAEAQAAGLPVVTTALAALTERVDQGEDGYLVAGPAGEPSARREFVNAVVGLLTNDGLRQRMGEQSAGKARRAYGWEVVARQWECELRPMSDRPACLPPVVSQLDLLAPEHLRLSDRGAQGEVPPEEADRWIRADWASYGLDPAEVPGLH
jgi:glycosyltransferase involved in cell wall biosynthesis